MRIRLWVLGLCLAFSAATACAHETRPAYLEIAEKSDGQLSVLWKSPTQGDPPISLHPILGGIVLENLPGDCTKVSGAILCQWQIAAPNTTLAGRRITIDGLSATVTDALVRIDFADGLSTTRLLRPADPSWVIEHRDSSRASAAGFFRMGVEHILYGIDHLLFVLLLLLIVRSAWVLVETITAFTVAHTITLGMAVLGFVRVTAAPVEAVIALSILFLASELAHHHRGEHGLTYRAPWIVAFSFGLLHGFGFAGALANVGLPYGDIPRALLFFNLGVEAGQLSFIVVALGIVRVIRSLRVRWPAWSLQVPAYAIGSLAAFWFVQRCALIW